MIEMKTKDEIKGFEGQSTKRLTQTELVSECIEHIGMGPYQWKLFFLCGLGWAADSMYMQAISVMQPQIKLELNLNNRDTSLLTTFMLLGMMFGALFWGSIADIIGRYVLISLLISLLLA